ncbi:MAG TPA: class I SAM-dependent methyltransferase [Leptolyngbya sp.]|nr:class I SAM-dependent methyltransferase [Leptolyngbya sp.]
MPGGSFPDYISIDYSKGAKLKNLDQHIDRNPPTMPNTTSSWIAAINERSTKDLEQRKAWYSPVVEAYDRARPRYPKAMIQRVIEVAHLSPDSKILEVGCGSGVATIDFAPLGCAIEAIEPNVEFCRLVEQKCKAYPNVKIISQSFEEWQVEPQTFQIVLAANAWHWIASDIKYVKAAQTLKDHGALVLLWNLSLQPRLEVHQEFDQIYQRYAPTIAPRYEDAETQQEILQGLGQLVTDSGLFNHLISESVACEVTYDIDRYLDLLSTQYITLDAPRRDALFAELKSTIEQQYNGEIQLFNLAAYQIATKK